VLAVITRATVVGGPVRHAVLAAVGLGTTVVERGAVPARDRRASGMRLTTAVAPGIASPALPFSAAAFAASVTVPGFCQDERRVDVPVPQRRELRRVLPPVP